MAITIYQVYLRSIGTYRDLTRNLNYFVELGIDYLWINPTFPHGGKDGGYDITDYYGVSPEFGTLLDMEEFIKQAHILGLRIIIDLVMNHTSNAHPWFVDSMANGEKKDWYCWQPSDNDINACNWISEFVQSPWTYCPERKQYYYHYFYPEQPDLSYECPEVIDEMFRIFSYWIEKGVDGFRLDAVSHVMEEPGNNETNYCEKQINTETNFQFWSKVRNWIDTNFPGIILIGETNHTHTTHEQINRYKEIFHYVMDFNFLKLLDSQKEKILELTPNAIDTLDSRGCYFLNNHDMFRARYGESDPTIAQHVAKLLLSVPGAVIIYYGEEVGLLNQHTDLEYPENRVASRGRFDLDSVTKNNLWYWYRDLIHLRMLRRSM